LGGDGGDDAGVDGQEFEARLVGAGLGLSGGDDDDGRVFVGLGGRGGADGDGGVEGRAVGEVEGLAGGEVGVEVGEDDFFGGARLGEGVGGFGADGAGADDNDFAGGDRSLAEVKGRERGRGVEEEKRVADI